MAIKLPTFRLAERNPAAFRDRYLSCLNPLTLVFVNNVSAGERWITLTGPWVRMSIDSHGTNDTCSRQLKEKCTLIGLKKCRVYKLGCGPQDKDIPLEKIKPDCCETTPNDIISLVSYRVKPRAILAESNAARVNCLYILITSRTFCIYIR